MSTEAAATLGFDLFVAVTVTTPGATGISNPFFSIVAISSFYTSISLFCKVI